MPFEQTAIIVGRLQSNWCRKLYNLGGIYGKEKKNIQHIATSTYNSSKDVMLPISLGILPLIMFHIKSLYGNNKKESHIRENRNIKENPLKCKVH